MEKNLTDNYEKQIYIGRDLFLRYDQDMLIKKYKLKNDHAYLYLNYIGTEYSIVMTIYDLLCYSEDKPLPPLTGQWQPVTRFIPTGSSPSGDVFTPKYEAAFSGKVNVVSQACLCLGGELQKWEISLCCSSSGTLMRNSLQKSYCCGIRYPYRIFILRQPFISRDIYWKRYCRKSMPNLLVISLVNRCLY